MTDPEKDQKEASDEEVEPKATWEKRNFALNDNMKQVCKATAAATRAEIASLRRKLHKLQYGG